MDGTNRTEYDEIVAGSRMELALLSLCNLVRDPDFAGMGLYVVDALTGYTEYVPQGRTAVTYVDLTLITPWYMAEKHPVARIAGGPTGNPKVPDEVGLWRVSLKVGEKVGLILMDQRADNRSYYDIHPLGLFHGRSDGGYTNGQLFTQRRVDEAELGQLVKGLAGGTPDDPCPYDDQPDTGEANAPLGATPTQRVAGVDAGLP